MQARSVANLQLDLLDIEIAANKTEQAKLVEVSIKKMNNGKFQEGLGWANLSLVRALVDQSKLG